MELGRRVWWRNLTQRQVKAVIRSSGRIRKKNEGKEGMVFGLRQAKRGKSQAADFI